MREAEARKLEAREAESAQRASEIQLAKTKSVAGYDVFGRLTFL